MNTAAEPSAKVPVVPYDGATVIGDLVAADREERDVHGVYEAIAPHFSSTRYKVSCRMLVWSFRIWLTNKLSYHPKPWPLIASYLSRVPPNSLGLDSGAGNGKYLPVLQSSSEGSFLMALDRSSGLLEIAQKQGAGDQECLRGDLCFRGWRDGVFVSISLLKQTIHGTDLGGGVLQDFIISIAAIHHLSTHSRRVQSIRAILKPLAYSSQAPFATFIVYVWAFEQSESSKRKMGSAAVAGTDDGMTPEQDVLVPWVLQQPAAPKEPQERQRRGWKGKERSRETEETEREDSTTGLPKEVQSAAAQTAQPQVYHRYYHLFKEGELRQLVLEAAREEGLDVRGADDKASSGSAGSRWLRIVGEGYERDNWWLEGEVGLGV